jgi:hypothetical protein
MQMGENKVKKVWVMGERGISGYHEGGGGLSFSEREVGEKDVLFSDHNMLP